MKVGKVNIEKTKGSIRLRWTDPFLGRRSLTICSAKTNNGINLAKAKASEIDADLAKELLGITGSYDPTLEKYKVGYVTRKRSFNLLEIWEEYKKENKEICPNSRKQSVWKIVDNMLAKLSKQQLLPEKSGQIVKELKQYYAPSTLQRCGADIVKATNDWAKYEGVDNPWEIIRSQTKLSKKQGGRSKQAWNQDELNAIRESFKVTPSRNIQGSNSIAHNYYYSYVSFLILTGCRPEEAIALEWNDIDWTKMKVTINKAFSYGQLKETKNEKTRKIPINSQLDLLLRDECSSAGKSRLVFPSTTSEYIVQKNFNSRNFKPRIKKLYDEGIISKELPCYNLRNSWITFMLSQGIDIATVAKLAGTSERMIMDNYWGANDSVEIPEI